MHGTSVEAVRSSEREGRLRDAVAPAFAAYAALASRLLAGWRGCCLFDHRLSVQGAAGGADPAHLAALLRRSGTIPAWPCEPRALPLGPRDIGVIVRFAAADGELLGVFCVVIGNDAHGEMGAAARAVAGTLGPLFECMEHDLSSSRRARSRIRSLAARTADLEWLLDLSADARSARAGPEVLRSLLEHAVRRLDAELAVLCVPRRNILARAARAGSSSPPPLAKAWEETRPHLLTWVHRQKRPLILNRPSSRLCAVTPCKLLCVPIAPAQGAAVGLMVFYRTPDARGFVGREIHLARHLGRQSAGMVDEQFDLMTGLYTRDGLEQMCRPWLEDDGLSEHSVIYLDVDHMHVVNELHGFELGNELIIRVADLLCVPLLPPGALAARISGDRFLIVLPHAGQAAATAIADTLRAAAGSLKIGPSAGALEVSIRCGVAALLPLPDGLARAMAAAEIACKVARDRGRDRVEVYAFDDGSMIRRHSEALAVGRLRSAIKNDRMLLYVQRIAPLRDFRLPGGYEVLLRVREENGDIEPPGALVEAAQRYQLFPSLDRWVVNRALEILTAFRTVIGASGLSISLNVSGQSISDEAFVRHLAAAVRAAMLPPGSLSIELTEQAAITNLACAQRAMGRLKELDCRFSLDDFGTGTNSLATLKSLDIARVKIDGSFVRDFLTNQNSRATVEAIVALARGLGIETVAEYVESEDQAAELERMGVDYAQGYFFGRPAPIEEVLRGVARAESQRSGKLFF